MRARAFAKLSASLMIWVTACASGAPPPARQPAASSPTSGAEPVAAAPAVEPPAAVDEPGASPSAASGPAKIAVDARVRGQSVAADVRLIGPGGEEVAHGSSGESLQASSGEYEMQITIRDAAALADKPTQRRALTLSRGDELHEPV